MPHKIQTHITPAVVYHIYHILNDYFVNLSVFLHIFNLMQENNIADLKQDLEKKQQHIEKCEMELVRKV